MKPNFILDLDETILNSISTNEAQKIDDDLLGKSEKYTVHEFEDQYVVFERPGLQSFLDYLFENFEVSIWTAATLDYAVFMIKNMVLIKPGRHLKYFFWVEHCKLSSKLVKGLKSIKILEENFKLSDMTVKNTVILDDNEEVRQASPENCIVAPDFKFLNENSENDNFLLRLQDKLCQLKNVADVRPVVKKINKELKQA